MLEEPLLFPRQFEPFLGLLLQLLGHLLQAGIASHSHDIVNLVAFAPREYPIPAESAVGTPNNPCLRPALANPFDQQLEDGPGVLAGIDLARPQIGYQQLIATKNIERQKTVMVVITVEKATLLEPVHRIVGGVKVQDNLFGRFGKGAHELLDQQLVHGKSRPPILPVFKTTQSRRAGQRFGLSRGRLPQGIVAQGIKVVQILIARHQPVNTLPEHGQYLMAHLALLPFVHQLPGRLLG